MNFAELTADSLHSPAGRVEGVLPYLPDSPAGQPLFTRLAVMLLAVSAILALPASADTAVYSATEYLAFDPDIGTADTNISLPQFSPANGQLTGISLTLSFNFDSSYTFENDAGSAGQIDYTPHAQVIGTIWPLAPDSLPADVILPLQTTPFSAVVATVTDSASGGPGNAILNIDPAQFAVFTGTSYRNLDRRRHLPAGGPGSAPHHDLHPPPGHLPLRRLRWHRDPPHAARSRSPRHHPQRRSQQR